MLAGHTEHALMSLAPTAKQFAEVQMEIVPNKALSLSLSLSLSLALSRGPDIQTGIQTVGCRV